MIYLFCNEGYGAPFLEAALKYAAGGGRLTVVYSAKARGPKGLRGCASRLKSLVVRFMAQRKLARRLGTRVLLVRNINSWWFHRRIAPNDHGIVAGFNQIFKPSTIGRFRSLVNFHPSLLPFYRGPVPSFWVIRNGEEWTGYTLHRITPVIDRGEALYQESIAVDGAVEPTVLDERIAARAASTLCRYLEHLQTGEEWKREELDASRLYRTRVDYASFPAMDR